MHVPAATTASRWSLRRHNERIRGTGHIDELDGLRALAVLPVIALHFGAAVDGGAGVTVFFALSGYIVTTLLLDERRRSGSIDIGAFYARRARRLVPAASLVVLATVAYGQIAGRPPITREAIAALTYWANFERFSQQFTYGLADYAPLEHFWSLAIEEQFYLVLPLLLAVTMRRGRSVPVAVCSILALGSAVFALATADQARMYFHTGTRACELLVGVLLAILRIRLPQWAGALGIAGLVAVFAQLISPPYVVVALLACVVIAGRPRLLAAAPLVTIGAYSYSLYLWHPLAALLADSMPLRIGLTAALALASFHLVERPVRRTLAPRRAAVATVGLSLGAASLALALAVVRQPLEPTFAQDRLAEALAATSVPAPDDSAAAESDQGQEPASTDAERPAPVRISGVGDSTQMFASATWRAWADLHPDDLTWVMPPDEILPWTSGADSWIREVAPTAGLSLPLDGPQGGLDRQGCPLIYDLMVRPDDTWNFFDSALLHSATPESSCDWNRWIPTALAQMDADVIVASWGKTIMWQYLLADGSTGELGVSAFDVLLVERMADLERMAAEFGTRVLWLTYDLQSESDEEERRLTVAEDRFAEIVLDRPCAFDLRTVVRSTTTVDWYQDGYHFTVDGALRVLQEILPSIRECATTGRTTHSTTSVG
ncbi:MAG: acyltransferase family protein [Ilumatobacteraceae bacterium]